MDGHAQTAAPAAPTNIHIAVDCNKISGTKYITFNITWIDVATNEKGYKVFADNDGTPRAILGANTTNVSITYKWVTQGAPANRKFLVEAYNNVGTGKREKIVPNACP